jgi:hypothetical protein
MNQRGNTLVGMLVVMAIIAILAVGMFFGSGMLKGGTKSPRADGKGKTVPGLVRLEAKDTVCRSNLSNLRSSIEILKINAEDTPPSALEETRLGSSFYNCPVGGEQYTYDPSTGTVGCPHPGHEKY